MVPHAFTQIMLETTKASTAGRLRGADEPTKLLERLLLLCGTQEGGRCTSTIPTRILYRASCSLSHAHAPEKDLKETADSSQPPKSFPLTTRWYH